MPPAIVLRGQSSERPDSERQPRHRPQIDDQGSSRLRCRACGRVVATSAALFSISGGDSPSVFVNPHGCVFEIVTLRSAQGLSMLGPPTLEHTWFPGYAWQIACCGQCFTHLGWVFRSAIGGQSPATFYGLIRGRLAIEEGATD